MSRLSINQQIKQATPIESGNGFKVYSVNANGGSRDVIVINHSVLVKQVHMAEKYAAKNGGDLPNTRFWNLTTSIFREDKALFRKLHQCRELIAVLRRNEAHDRNNPTTPTPTPPPPDQQPQVIIPPNSGGGTSPNPPNVGAVPEPASVLMMGIGLVAVLVIGKLKLGLGRKAPAVA